MEPDGATSVAVEESVEAQRRRNQAVIDLLDSWEQDEPEEQLETWALLKQTLDEDRLSYRKLFPEA